MRRDDMSLDRLLADPLIRLIMKSDGVVEGDILALARRHQAHRVLQPSAFASRRPCWRANALTPAN